MKRFIALLSVVSLFVGIAAISGCEKKEPTLGDAIKETGKEMEKAADKAGEKIDEAAKETGKALEEAGDKAKDATN